MKKENGFDTWKYAVNNLIAKHPLQVVSWEATRKCNLNCQHCGSPSERTNLEEELSTNEVIEAFKEIERNFDMSKFRHINITGGEPFVRKDLLHILGEISKNQYFRNIDIQTNGIILGKNPEIIEQLKPLGVTGIGVSIDGPKEIHDNFRRKSGSYDLAFKAAQEAVKRGMTTTVSIVANPQNINHIPEFYEKIKNEIHPRTFRIMTCDPLGRAEESPLTLNSKQTKEVINFLHEKYLETFQNYANPNSTMVELGCGGWLGKDLEGMIRPFIFHCIAGLNNLGILYDGKLAACSNIPREFGFEGDLKKDSIKDIWENKYQRYRESGWKKTGECKSCTEWDYCHGGPMHKMKEDGSRTDCLYQTLSKTSGEK